MSMAYSTVIAMADHRAETLASFEASIFQHLPAPFRDSDWASFRQANSDTLLITFSNVDVPRGKFAPHGSLRALAWNILRFNCPNERWYPGFPG